MSEESPKAKLVGINHVALEVGDIEQALAFYGRIFAFELRGRAPGMAFIDMGDQFIALSESAGPTRDEHRHFGLVVDDREPVRRALEAVGAEILPGHGLDFRDPWGNRVQVVVYRDIQFTKAPAVLAGIGVDGAKSEGARRELSGKGMLDE